MTTKQHPAAEFLAKYAWKRATVELGGETRDACFFDWFAVSANDDAEIAKGKALPEAERDRFFNHVHLWTADFDQYFAGIDGGELVERGEWLPFAVLGLGNPATLESFAEMSNDGFLALVTEGEHKGAVIWYYDDETTVVADSLDELTVELAGSDSEHE